MVESIATFNNRAYRKSLSGSGLIYLGAVEYEIKLRDLSLTGMLAELKSAASLPDIKDLFNAVQLSPVIDIYLPDLRLAGEAEIARVELTEDSFLIGLEFRHLSYDIDSLLYNRRAYRKAMTAPGHIVLNEVDYEFSTENVSVDGLMIRILGRLEVEVGTIARFEFKHLEIEGEAKVVWTERGFHSTVLGMQYQHLERSDLKGIPRFVRP